ncbi:helix-turn-helix transcriptional regulator [Gammaproteobacteria bacterium]|nr:helix-turn-helix transcriptional regulator [Gammaproteobacteria bacterium]
MSETTALIDALKRALKHANKTYADVAEALFLSEASVKQMFATQRLTLSRLDSICVTVLGIEMSDLVSAMIDAQPQITMLTEHQEQQLVSNVRLLVVAVSVMKNWTGDEITHEFDMDAAECAHHLRFLETLKLLIIRPNGAIKLQVARNFDWIPNGPIQRYFQTHIRNDFLASSFEKSDERLIFLTGSFAESTHAEVVQRMEKFAADFREINERDNTLPQNRRVETSLVMAYRPWPMEAFAALKRKNDNPQ